MSRLERPIHSRSSRIHWRLALPALGLALAAALHAQAGTVPDTPRQSSIVHQAGKDDAYALVSAADKGMSVTGDGTDWQSLAQVRRTVGGDFLWFRDDGKAWYVQDPAVLAKVRAAWAPVNRLGDQMNEYGKEMTQHGKAMDGLGKDMSQAAAGMRLDQDRMQALQRSMNALGSEMGRLGAQMAEAGDVERNRLAGQMAHLSTKMDALTVQMRAASQPAAGRAAGQSMQDVGQRMDDAGKPMDALGKKMDALGKRMQAESAATDKTVRALIRDAMARGLARPAPQG